MSPAYSAADIRRLLDRRRHDFLDTSTGRGLARLRGLLRLVRTDGFSGGSRRFLKDDSIPSEPLLAVEYVAERISRDLGQGTDASLFSKALQEAILEAAGLEYDLDLLDIDLGLKTYLDRHDVWGFVRLFLGLYVFHAIWISIEEEASADLPDEKAFLSLMSAIGQFSRSVVTEAVAEATAAGDLELPEADVRLIAEIRDRVLKPRQAGADAG